MDEQSQHNEIGPNKWSDAFDQSLARVFDNLANKLTAARVLEHVDRQIKEPCSEEEGRSYDRATGKDFFRLDESGNVIEPEIRYRFGGWHPQFAADATVSNGFLARANVEKWRNKPEPLPQRFQGVRVVESNEPEREIIGQFFCDARQFLKTHTPCQISVIEDRNSGLTLLEANGTSAP